MLLYKDSTKRPTVSALLMTPFAKEKMQEFIENGGFIGNANLHVRKLRSKAIEDNEDESTVATPSKGKSLEESKHMHKSRSFQDEDAGLTPKELMLKRKQQKIEEKERQMKAAARGAIENYKHANKRKYDEFNRDDEQQYDSGKVKGGHKSQRVNNKGAKFESNSKMQNTHKNVVIGDPKKVYVSNYCADPIDERAELSYKHGGTKGLGASSAFSDSFGANDRCDETYGRSGVHNSTFAANDRCEDTFGANDR